MKHHMPVMLAPKGDPVRLRNELGRKFNNTIANIRHARHANELKPPAPHARRVPLPARLLACCERFGVP